MSGKSNFSLSFNSLMTNRAEATELSESRYNLLIGLLLVWGFGLNYAITKLLQNAILSIMLSSNTYIGFVIAYFILVIAGSNMVRSDKPAKCFLGYNLIALPIGVLLAMTTAFYDPALITRAALCTAIVTLVMLIAATAFPSFFKNIGGGLSVSLLAVILVEGLGSLFFRGVFTVMDWVVVGIMCLYIGYDWTRANTVQPTVTNAIAAASALYLDIVNIFLRLLRILGRSRERN